MLYVSRIVRVFLFVSTCPIVEDWHQFSHVVECLSFFFFSNRFDMFIDDVCVDEGRTTFIELDPEVVNYS